MGCRIHLETKNMHKDASFAEEFTSNGESDENGEDNNDGQSCMESCSVDELICTLSESTDI